MKLRTLIIIVGGLVLITGSTLWLLPVMKGTLSNPAPKTDPCPDDLLTGFLAGDQQATAQALEKTANTLEQAFRNPTTTCFLSLTGANLVSLPGSIGQLSNMRYMNLADDKLTSLPSEIAELRRLTVLDLNDNEIMELPLQFYTLTNLETLALVRNNLTEIPNGIAKLSGLKQIYLTGNPLSQTQIDQIRSLLPHTEVVF